MYLFHLKGRVTEKEGHMEKDLPSTGSLLKWLQWLGLVQAEAKRSIPVSHMAGRGTST